MAAQLKTRPAVFVGSSDEARDVATGIQFHLQGEAEVTIWSHGVFGPNLGYLESLVSALDRFDFAVLILSPDDVVKSREDVSLVPRDNIMFELGLFMGRLGRNRTFAVCSDAPNMRIPTDLAGVSLLRFESTRADSNWVAATNLACATIKKGILELGFSDLRSYRLLSTATRNLEGASNHAERMINLMARSRILELELIHKQFGSLLPESFLNQLSADLNELRAETASSPLAVSIQDKIS